jgi:hypothetical protein
MSSSSCSHSSSPSVPLSFSAFSCFPLVFSLFFLIFFIFCLYLFSVLSNLTTASGNSLQNSFGFYVSSLHSNGTTVSGFASQYPPLSSGRSPLVLPDLFFCHFSHAPDDKESFIVNLIPVALLIILASNLIVNAIYYPRLAVYLFVWLSCWEIVLLTLNGFLHVSSILPDPLANQTACINKIYENINSPWPLTRFSTQFCSDCLYSGHTFHSALAAALVFTTRNRRKTIKTRGEKWQWKDFLIALMELLLPLLLAFLVFVEMILILKTRNHYGIDCLTALVLVLSSCEAAQRMTQGIYKMIESKKQVKDQGKNNQSNAKETIHSI